MVKVAECPSTNDGNKTAKMPNLRGRKTAIISFFHNISYFTFFS